MPSSKVQWPRKAFVLAAGFGTRLLPLTRDLPKPLIPILQVPNLERILRLLRRWNVEDVLINIHHRADRIVDYVRKRPADGLRIALSFEPVILGTGGALRKAEWWFDKGDPFWVINADIVADLNPAPLLAAYEPLKTIAVVWVDSRRGPQTVDVRNGEIRSFQTATPGAPETYTFCGVHLVNPVLLDRSKGFLAPDPKFESIITAYEKARAAGWRVAAVELPGAFWADIGTPRQWLDCTRALCGGGSFVDAHPTAIIHPRAFVQNAIIGAGARLGPRARVENAIVAAGTRVNWGVKLMALKARAAFSEPLVGALSAAGWDPDQTTALPLDARGSQRAFTRIACGRRTAILVEYDARRVENTLYARHARFLRSLDLPVPEVLADWPSPHASLFEDLGDESLQCWTSGRHHGAIAAKYRAVIEVLARWHRHATAAARRRKIPLMPSFGPELYRWERNYFADQMLRKREKLPEPEIAAILRELAAIARPLVRCKAALLHRDFQSSNILIARGRPWVIDFQGMRFGPPAYDVASLLCDPYVELPEPLIEELLEAYARLSPYGNETIKVFWPAAIQRLAQALGAFARLGASPETREFARHIPAARRMMLRALARVRGGLRLRQWCERDQ